MYFPIANVSTNYPMIMKQNLSYEITTQFWGKKKHIYFRVVIF